MQDTTLKVMKSVYVSNVTAGKRSIARVILRALIRTSLGVSVIVLIILAFVLHKSASPGHRIDPRASKRLAEEIRSVQSESNPNTPRVLHVDEGEVNSVIDSQLALTHDRMRSNPVAGKGAASEGQVNVQDLKVGLAGDRLHIYLLLDMRGKNMSIDLEGKLRSQSGYMMFDPLSGKVGALPIPQTFLQKIVQAIMDSPQYRQGMRLPPSISDLKVENSEFVFTYR